MCAWSSRLVGHCKFVYERCLAKRAFCTLKETQIRQKKINEKRVVLANFAQTNFAILLNSFNAVGGCHAMGKHYQNIAIN